MRIFKIVFIALAMSGMSVFADTSLVFTLRDIEKAALEYSPAIREAVALVGVSEGVQKSARLWSDPEFSVARGRGKSLESGERRNETGYEISQKIPWPGAYKAARQAARSGVQAAEYEKQRTIQEVLSLVRKNYYRTLLMQEQAELLIESRNAAKETYEKTVRRVELGESREVEKYRVHVEVLRMEVEHRKVKIALGAARRELDAATGGQLGNTFILAGALDIPAQIPSHQNVVTQALENNPKYAKLKALGQEAVYRRKEEKQKRFPQWTLSGFQEKELDRKGYGLGLSFRVPLWNQNRGAALSAVSEERAAQARLESLRLSLSGKTYTAYQRLKGDYITASGYSEILVQEAGRAFKLARFAYEQGEAGLLEYLDALRVYVKVKVEGLEASYRYYLSEIELRKLTGETYENTNP